MFRARREVPFAYAGTFYTSGTIILPSYTKLEGSGRENTFIELRAFSNTAIIKNQKAGDQYIEIRDLPLRAMVTTRML